MKVAKLVDASLPRVNILKKPKRSSPGLRALLPLWLAGLGLEVAHLLELSTSSTPDLYRPRVWFIAFVIGQIGIAFIGGFKSAQGTDRSSLLFFVAILSALIAIVFLFWLFNPVRHYTCAPNGECNGSGSDGWVFIAFFLIPTASLIALPVGAAGFIGWIAVRKRCPGGELSAE